MNNTRRAQIEELAAELSSGRMPAPEVQQQLKTLLDKERASYVKYSKLEATQHLKESAEAQQLLTTAIEALETPQGYDAALDAMTRIVLWKKDGKATPDAAEPEEYLPLPGEYLSDVGGKTRVLLDMSDPDWKKKQRRIERRARARAIREHGWTPEEYDEYLGRTSSKNLQ